MGYPSFNAGDVLTAADMNAVGLWKVTPTVSGTGATVSGSSVILTAAPDPYIKCFSADYRNYLIIASFTAFSGAGATGISMRAANGTTPNTTAANHRWALSEASYATGAAVVASNNGTIASLTFGRYDGTTAFATASVQIQNPFDSANNWSYWTQYRDGTVTGTSSGFLTVTTSYDSFNVRIDGTRTMTGRIDIYGYKN